MSKWHADFFVGEWRASPKLNTISNDDESIRLAGKSMAVLACLADAEGDVLAREQIFDTVWPGVEVTDDVLTQSIVELRKALGDDAKNPRYIETIPRVGFRLIADVRGAENASAHSSFSGSKRRIYLAVAAIFVVAISAWHLLGSEDTHRSSVITAEERHSIVVLPFASISDVADNDFFADGISEEIRTLLATTPALKVIGRTTSQAYKNSGQDARTVGEELGVNSILEGSVRRSNDRVRISVQLVDTADGVQLWSDTFDRTIDDIFSVQEDVAVAVTDALQVQIGAASRRVRATENTDAYILFLQATSAINNGEWSEATEYLSEAIALDPDFARAWELLAYNHWVSTGILTGLAEGQKLVGEAAAKAVALDPSLAFARALAATADVDNYSFLREIEAYEQAVLQEPGNAAAHYALAYYLLLAGYLDEAALIAEQNVRIDPNAEDAVHLLYLSYLSLGRVQEALDTSDIVDWEYRLTTHLRDAERQLALGQHEAAIASLERATARVDGLEPEWARALVTGASDPVTGQALLDEEIPRFLNKVPDGSYFVSWLVLSSYYQHFGFLDRQFEVILATDPGPVWSGAEGLFRNNIVLRQPGFTSHPMFLEVAEKLDIINVWEHRGPPDFCRKAGDNWVCD